MGKVVLRKRFDFPDAADQTAAWFRSPDFRHRDLADVRSSEDEDGWWVYLTMAGPSVTEGFISDLVETFPDYERVD